MSKNRKKKRSAAAIFLIGFGRSVFIIGLLLLTGFASYKASLFYFNERGVPKRDKASAVIQELYGQTTVEDVSKNLIYSVDKKSGKIKSIVLEIFNTKTGNMDYVTLPLGTEFTISNELYEKLLKGGCEAPQIVRLSRMHKYFSEDTLYEYGELIISDLLGIDVGYYTVLPQPVFKQMFQKSERRETVETEAGATVQTVPVWVLKDSYKDKLKALPEDEKAVKDYIETAYEKCTSNLSVRAKKKYAADYLKWKVEDTHYHTVPGILEETVYRASAEEAKGLLAEILGNSAYTGAQEDTSFHTTADSKGCKIQILNASQINGLAAEYQTLLEEQGYTIDSIGNYMGQMQTESSILVRSADMGADLLLYLEGSRLTVSEALPEGIDIQIILGTDADNERK